MALIKCPECGRDVSDKAVSCPNCGYPLSVNSMKQYSFVWKDGNTITYNGIDIKLNEIVEIYGTSKSGAISYVRRTYGITQEEAEKIFDSYYANIKDENPELNEKLVKQRKKEISVISREGEKQYKAQQKAEKEQQKLIKAQTAYFNSQARCPRCRSTSISYDTKKLSVGRALVGDALAGPTGAILGGLSSKKGYAVCLNCGKRWKI